MSRLKNVLLLPMVVVGALGLTGCPDERPAAFDGAVDVDGASSDGPAGAEAAIPDGGAGDGATADSSAPFSKPFGVWSSTCTATPYPNDVSNAYPTSFKQAVADDWVYVAWVWRLSPDAATNHSVSAMKSKDMKTWFNLCGAPVSLPVTPASPTVIDATPIKMGLLNSRLALSFDSAKRAVVTYQKNIEKKLNGSTKLTTQVFNARWESSAIMIYQLTNWDSLDAFGGGGSLPASDTSISFSGLRLASSGIVAQTLRRSKADDVQCGPVEGAGGTCSAFPKSGTWELHDAPSGLGLRSPLTSVSAATLASPDPFENPPTPALVTGAVEKAPLSKDPNTAKWQILTKKSRTQARWISLRADFDGNGSNNPGLYDRYNSVFRLDDGVGTAVFQFGARDGLFWPLAGDWNADGDVTIGVHDTKTNTTHLKNTLSGGVADVTLSGPVSSVPNISDSPLIWHPVNPAARYAIKWEALPANRDCGYSCDGVSLYTNGACQKTLRCQDATAMSSNLYLFEYDTSTSAWKKSLIDQAWGGTRVGFDFVTFKNVQLVLYYGKDRHAKIAQRVRSGNLWSAWEIATLSTQFGGWDSHNYLTMTIDINHNVHVSGNMHASPLVYFRGTGYFGGPAALTYTKMPMTGQNESSTTYPTFFRGPDGTLLFYYRSGSSGSGDSYLNRYDEHNGSWHAMHGAAAPIPIFKGK